MRTIKFGIRLPAFPLENSRGSVFRVQAVNTLTVLDGQFNSIWVADHFILRFADFPSTHMAEAFAQEVIPRF